MVQSEAVYIRWDWARVQWFCHCFRSEWVFLDSDAQILIEDSYTRFASGSNPTKTMLHAYDGTGRDQPPPYNATIDLNFAIALVGG